MDRESLCKIMDLYNLKQHVHMQMHKQGNTIDWIISKENSTTISGINEGEYLSDNCTITWIHKVEKQPMEKINHTGRNLKSINEQNFASDLTERLSKLSNIDNLHTLYERYIHVITSTLDQHASETIKKTKRLAKSWYDKDAHKLKRQRRVTEKAWLKTKSDSHKKNTICI